MYCKGCGKEVADDSKYCQHCGIKLVNMQMLLTNVLYYFLHCEG